MYCISFNIYTCIHIPQISALGPMALNLILEVDMEGDTYFAIYYSLYNVLYIITVVYF